MMQKNNLSKLFLFLCISFTAHSVIAMPLREELSSGWKFKQWRLTNWYPATVPGVIHLDLLANKIIEDPFFRINERGVQWVDKEDWMYETHFDVNDEMFNKSNMIISLKTIISISFPDKASRLRLKLPYPRMNLKNN